MFAILFPVFASLLSLSSALLRRLFLVGSPLPLGYRLTWRLLLYYPLAVASQMRHNSEWLDNLEYCHIGLIYPVLMIVSFLVALFVSWMENEGEMMYEVKIKQLQPVGLSAIQYLFGLQMLLLISQQLCCHLLFNGVFHGFAPNGFISDLLYMITGLACGCVFIAPLFAVVIFNLQIEDSLKAASMNRIAAALGEEVPLAMDSIRMLFPPMEQSHWDDLEETICAFFAVRYEISPRVAKNWYIKHLLRTLEGCWTEWLVKRLRGRFRISHAVNS